MFAPKHHKAMAHVVPVRKELAVRTIFNFLGPLTNPAGAAAHLLGVSDRGYQEIIADALLQLGCARALVVSADDGIDELSVASRTRVIEVADGGTEEWFVEPGELGLRAGAARGDPRRRAGRERRGRQARARRVRPVRPAMFPCSTPAPRSMSPGRRRPRGGGRQGDAGVDSGVAFDVLDRLVARSRELSARELGCLPTRWA